ncbi:MAG: poly-beta-1,6-N-acetyl-D-glucosamine N-deacetylase PgaB, partial [bacterium]|nr:poly-beta-1,6-N-acetyl-D-glucosamine N-deacetylase PgaB [bacterium]
LEPRSADWFAQSYPLFLENYDHTVIMAMPYLEKAKNPKKWLLRLINEAKAVEPSLKKTIFQLQSKNWRTRKPVSTGELLEQMEMLQLNGALNYGYYPDDFIKGHPHGEKIREGISLKVYPYWER